MSESPRADRPFCRVIENPDFWTTPDPLEVRAGDFRGHFDDISVAHTEQCTPDLVVASLLGSRSGYGPLVAYYYRFVESEVIKAGGALRSSDAEPPWPSEYNEAHHDVFQGQEAVAQRMAAIHEEDRTRVVAVPQETYLGWIADLLARDDVHERFKKNAWKRLRRLLDEEPLIWAELASTRPHMLTDKSIGSSLRKMYSANRATHDALSAKVPALRTRAFTSG